MMRRNQASSTSQSILKRLGTAGLTFALLTMAHPGMAEYIPHPDAGRPDRSTTTTGPRGEDAQLALLAPLAPQQHVGHSASTRPTFTWFVPEGPAFRGEFRIYEIVEPYETASNIEAGIEVGIGQATDQAADIELSKNDDGGSTVARNPSFVEVLEQPHEFVSEPGFMSFSWPSEMEALKPDTNYIWQVLLRYGDRPSEVLMWRSQIKILASAHQTPTALSTDDFSTRADHLAASGLWYDALALTLELPALEAEAKRDELLEDLVAIELAELEIARSNADDAQLVNTEEQERIENLETHVQMLMNIVNREEVHQEAINQTEESSL